MVQVHLDPLRRSVEAGRGRDGGTEGREGAAARRVNRRRGSRLSRGLTRMSLKPTTQTESWVDSDISETHDSV